MARVMPRRRAGQGTQPEGPLFNATALLRGTLSAFILSLVLFAVVSVIFTYTSFSDRYMPLVATFAGVFSVLWGGFSAARLTERGAILHGSLVGLFYGLLVLALGKFVLSEPIASQVLWRMGGAILCGAVGGFVAPRPKVRRKR